MAEAMYPPGHPYSWLTIGVMEDVEAATRDEVEVLRDLVVAAREENERLLARVEALEARLGAGSAAPGAAPGGTPAQP